MILYALECYAQMRPKRPYFIQLKDSNLSHGQRRELHRKSPPQFYRTYGGLVADPKGFEPLTARLEGVCSIQLSYVDIAYFQLLN